jgi:hypothetical protein
VTESTARAWPPFRKRLVLVVIVVATTISACGRTSGVPGPLGSACLKVVQQRPVPVPSDGAGAFSWPPSLLGSLRQSGDPILRTAGIELVAAAKSNDATAANSVLTLANVYCGSLVHS